MAREVLPITQETIERQFGLVEQPQAPKISRGRPLELGHALIEASVTGVGHSGDAYLGTPGLFRGPADFCG